MFKNQNLCEKTRTFFKVELKIMFYFLNLSGKNNIIISGINKIKFSKIPLEIFREATRLELGYFYYSIDIYIYI